jgi:hypothetical protein
VAILRAQGVEVRRIAAPWTAAAEAFLVDSLIVEPLFEGHRTIRVEGAWGPAATVAQTGWYMVSTDQRLGTFAAYLLEPASEDGLLTWNLFDRNLRRGQSAPVWRIRVPLNVPAELVP